MSDQPAPLISVFPKKTIPTMTEVYDLPKTHRALVQKVYAEPMTVEEVPMPEIGPGSAILRIESASIISYQREVYNGTRKYPYPTPWTPGLHTVGRVVAAGPDAVAVEPGSLVYFDGFIRGRDDPSVAIISGLSDVGDPRAQKLLGGEWRNSTYAQYARVPLENCFPLDETRLCKPASDGGLGCSFDQLAWIGMPLVGYGGLRRIEVQAGETVIIAPATGGFGGAATMAALAMGARVIAMGRNEKMLRHLEDLSPRVRTVKMTGDHDNVVKDLTKYGRPDALLDLSPPAGLSSNHLKSAIVSLRKGGRVSLMGGLLGDMKFPTGEIVFNDIELKGQWMYSPSVIRDMIKLIESGVLDLSRVTIAGKFDLEQWEQAFDVAANMRFDEMTVLSGW